MVDYTKTDGGTIMIRDTGTDVEYWFKAANSSSWQNGLDFSWTTSGGTATRSINYPTGGDWYKVGESTLTVSQTVTFRQTTNSGVSGIGPPKTLSKFISRGTVPDAPGAFYVSAYSNEYVNGDADPGGNGGSAILQWQFAWGTSPTVPGSGGGANNLSLSTGYGEVDNLNPGSLYYFWNRQRNAHGFGPWSPRTMLRMRNVPDPPDAPAVVSRTQTTITVRIDANYNGDSAIGAYRVRYGLDPDSPTNIGSSSTPYITLTGLSPGQIYYFWGQTANVYGDSPYSPRAYYQLVAGASVKVGPNWKRAVPYVKVNGVWRVARPWGKIAGFWNETPQ